MTSTPTRTSHKKSRPPYEGPTPEEKLVAALLQVLDAGVNPWRKDWQTTAANGEHRNLMTGVPYRGSNPAILEMWSACKGHSLPLWIGGGQAKKQGWFPRKGSTAAYILRPQLNSKEREDESAMPILGPDGKPETLSWTSFKPTPVFNVADITGKDEASADALQAAVAEALGSVVVRPEPERHAAAESVVSFWSEIVPTTWAGDKACYFPEADRISMPTRAQFHSPEGLYSTFLHEAVHSTGHKNRLCRDMGGRFSSDRYAREELVAELGAFLLCNRLEISSDIQNHASYLQHWSRVLKAEPKILFTVLGDSVKAANLISPEQIDAQPQAGGVQ